MTTAERAPKHKHMLKRSVRFGPHTCFLCSAPLRARNRSDEHVFPKWLQNRFDLWDQRLDLINLTSIPYRQLTIPCCKNCNNVHLSKIEDAMRAAVASGANAVEKLPASTVYMWLSKIFYGILYRESLLRADRRGENRPIVPKRVLQELRLHHDFMQGIRRSLDFPFGVPGSIFIFGTTQPERVESQFDFVDNHANLSIALRMGSVGIVGCLQDGGLTKEFHDKLNRPYYRRNRLHPMQFREATAEVFYKSMLLESEPFYTVLEDPHKMLVMTQNSAYVKFHEWDWRVYCKMLAYYWDRPVEEIYGGSVGRASSLTNEHGKFLVLDPNCEYRFLVP